MATYNVAMKVEYIFEVEADTPEEAESKAWEYDYIDDQASYAGVYSIDVEEVEEEEENLEILLHDAELEEDDE